MQQHQGHSWSNVAYLPRACAGLGAQRSNYLEQSLEMSFFNSVHINDDRECVLAHARASMLVDTGSVQELLYGLIPSVLRNDTVEALRRPWPEATAAGPVERTGLWWDLK